MRVKVKLDPLFRARVGAESTVALELAEGATVADALAALTARWPELEPLLEASHITHTMFVNSRIVPRGKAGAFALKDGDTLYLLEPVAGGH